MRQVVDCKAKTRAPRRASNRSKIIRCPLADPPRRPRRLLRVSSLSSPWGGRGTVWCAPPRAASCMSPERFPAR